MEAEEENFNLVDERMAMRIIQNKEENHLDEVKWLFGKSNKIVIVSPFLSKDAIQELGKILHAKISDVTMVTTLKPFDVDQFSKVKALVELNMLKKLRGYNLSIRIDNDLHGKVYIGKKDNQYVGCIITSANFTHKGMEQNHEWGVFLDDQYVAFLSCNKVSKFMNKYWGMPSWWLMMLIFSGWWNIWMNILK